MLYVISIIFFVILVYLWAVPETLTFLKKPTRWKVFWLWMLVFSIVIKIYTLTPTGKAEYDKLIANQPTKENEHTYYQRTDSNTSEGATFLERMRNRR